MPFLSGKILSLSSLFIFCFWQCFVSCQSDIGFQQSVIPLVPEKSIDSLQTDTVPIKETFPLVVVAELGKVVSWQEEDSMFASTIVDGVEYEFILHIDSIFEGNNVAVFVDTLNFTPDNDCVWTFNCPARKELSINQDGSFENLKQYISLTAIGYGKSPHICMQSNINVIQTALPKGTKSIVCYGGFEANINLGNSSKENDSLFIAVPVSCSDLLIIAAKNENGLVFRSNYIEKTKVCSGVSDTLFYISLVNKPCLSLEIKNCCKQYFGGNFSGITYLEEDKYAVIDDNMQSVDEGWYPFEISLDSNWQISNVIQDCFITSYLPNRDIEGITYNQSKQTVWLVGERDNVISEHLLSGARTGDTLVTSMFEGYATNNGLESLSYNNVTKLFWTTTEAGIKKDGGIASPIRTKQRTNILRFQSYNEDCSIGGQWIYETDRHQKSSLGDLYSFGVPTICALDDGRLLVMERESRFEYVSDGEVAFCHEKLYLVDPSITPEGELLEKTLLLELPSLVTVSKEDKTVSGEFANYEGMCLGPRLEDGSQVLMLVSDSQGNLSISYSLDSEPYVFPDIFLPIVLHFD